MSELDTEFKVQPYYPKDQWWCESIFISAAEAKPEVRSFKGPLADEIYHVLETTSEMLELINPDLLAEYLQPNPYITDRAKLGAKNRLLHSLSDDDQLAFCELSNSYRNWLGSVGYLYAKSIGDTTESPVGLIDDTPFKVQSAGGRTCAMNCFSMIAEAISGQQLRDLVVYNTVLWRAGDAIVDFEFYINALCSKFMEEQSGASVTPINITGATLTTIKDIIMKVKDKFPDARAYCTVPLRSDKFDNYWHQVVLLGDDETDVYCNNPGGLSPMPSQRIPKLEFYERWSTCLNMAHLFIVQDT